ncbi:MAG TPA: AMP-binding protein [Leptospiraceae bacterium]|nr:AMP-binding protein [Leptospiraceae bacterium]HMY45320.1 AMP-binding protein [Leptospiraceae bacterium]HNJ33631.1 AMP-binding protein [Leptospiraceae bacterium]HNN58171.1 AMP-binding protein [Leptospiraceae bacterium]
MPDLTLPTYTNYWIIQKSAEAYPDSIAQMFKEGGSEYRSITFRQMYDNIKAIAMGLKEAGAAKGDKIGLIADVGQRWIWTSLGVTTIGCVDVPRGTDATEQDLRYIFHHAECKIIFLENAKVFKKVEKFLNEFPGLKTIVFFDDPGSISAPGIQILTLASLMENGKKAMGGSDAQFHQIGQSIKEDDLATIIYTSGTTGNPKGVMHTQKSLSWEVDHAIRGIRVPPNGVTMGFLPPWHIAERLIEHVAIRTITAVAFTSVPTLAKDLAVARPTFLLSVPRVWESFYNRVMDNVKKASSFNRGMFMFSSWTAMHFSSYKDILLGLQYRLKKEFIGITLLRKLGALIALIFLFVPNLIAQALLGRVRQILGGRVDFAISGAGALPEYIDRFFYSIGVPIVETYGMTETVGVSARRKYPGTVIGTVGATFPGVEIKLVDDKGNIVTEPNVKGVAYHRGPHIMLGYYKEPEKTRAVLSEDGWLNSGDILVWTVGGQLKFAGRAKDTIVLLGGENVEPQPIEDALAQSDLIAQIVVVGQDKKTLGALIVPNAESVKKALMLEGKQAPESIEKWNEDPAIVSMFKNEIKALNSDKAGFKNFEKVTAFTLLSKEFQPGDELTQTLKVKRNVVFDKYQKEIERMY